VNDVKEPAPVVEWHPFDHDDDSTAPKHHNLVWIVEDFYIGVSLGSFDGFAFRDDSGSDDCSVSYWAEIAYPEPPAEWTANRDAEGDDDD
jgi:hypothetical protein